MTSGDNVLRVRRVSETRHGSEVTLLLEHVRLTLPFPHTQLTHLAARERYPLRRAVDRDRRYRVRCRRLRYSENKPMRKKKLEKNTR